MIPLEIYIDRLRYSKSGPVSFKFHSEVGNILNDNDSQVNNLHEDDKTLLNSDEIPLIP